MFHLRPFLQLSRTAIRSAAAPAVPLRRLTPSVLPVRFAPIVGARFVVNGRQFSTEDKPKHTEIPNTNPEPAPDRKPSGSADGSAPNPPSAPESAPGGDSIASVLWNIFSDPLHILRRAKTEIGSFVVRRYYDPTFELDDFIKGAEVAYRVVTDLYVQRKPEDLRCMVSPALLQAMREAWDTMDKEHVSLELKVDSIDDVHVHGVLFESHSHDDDRPAQEFLNLDVHLSVKSTFKWIPTSADTNEETIRNKLPNQEQIREIPVIWRFRREIFNRREHGDREPSPWIVQTWL